jgi:hypothetical protein
LNDTPVSVSGGGSIPEPFNLNDVTVWSDLICKFVCQTQTPFELRRFLQEVIEDKIMPVNAYNKDMLRKAEEGVKNEFYNIIVYCLKFLQSNQLLTETYLPTQRLKSICSLINQILMQGIRPLLNAEKEIRGDPNCPSIVRVLKEVKRAGTLDLDSNKNLITPPELSKLARLGIVTLYMDGRLEMTPLGKLVLPLLE